MKLEADINEEGLNPNVEVYSVKEVKRMVDVTESEDEKMVEEQLEAEKQQAQVEEELAAV